ncbi:MAG TPA: long-chain-fatty-acid--CoA ligase [Cytophagales bacterium]|nr:long-chain-fatty-acid--CoA ligase [Cytophagales bacterium]HAP65303.1 long-chain-fatty-acid--CoA ligase [Cytophagales bacterium]
MQTFPWHAKYPEGVRPEVPVQDFETLVDLIDNGLKKYADRPAFENMGKVMTYADIDKLSADFASYLQNVAGLKKGDRIAIQMPNLLQFPIAMFGALRAGMTVVNTNPLYTAREMEHQFNDSGATAIVVVSLYAAELQKIVKNTKIKTIIVTDLGDMMSGIKRPIVNFVVKNVRKMVPAYSLPTAIKFNDVLKQGAKGSYKKADLTKEDFVFLQYTGGTTGVSKGAALRHRNLVAHAAMIEEWFKPHLNGQQEQMITAIPMYHIFALSVNCLFMLNIGAKNILVTNPRDLPGFIKELSKHKFTLMTGVNTLFNALINHADIGKVDFSSMKACIGGGMAVQRAVAEKWKNLTGVALVEGYGLSETSPVLCCNPLDGTERTGTIGLPVPNTEIKIMNEKGEEVPNGEPGELCARGPQVFTGYYERPDETAKCFFDDWFRTGDIAVMEDDGFFKIVDRKKDMILVSGFNVYPNEVEDAIATHPKVLEVAAIGVPNEKSTEVVKVFVVKKDDSLTEEELIAHCRENMTGYKVPKHVEWKDELPKSNVGKILRRVLKEEEKAKSGVPA